MSKTTAHYVRFVGLPMAVVLSMVLSLSVRGQDALSRLTVENGTWQRRNGAVWSMSRDGEDGVSIVSVKRHTVPMELKADVHVKHPSEVSGTAMLELVDDRGTGFGIQFSFTDSWRQVSLVRFVNGKKRQAKTGHCAVQYVLKSRKFTGKLSLKLLVGRDRGQLYLGFFGQPPRYIQGAMEGTPFEPTTLKITTEGLDIGFSDLSFASREQAPPDLRQRQEVERNMPSWNEFAGSHQYRYQSSNGERLLFRDWMRLYRNGFDPVVNEQQAGQPGVKKHVGPFGDEPVYINHESVRDYIRRAAEHQAKLVINTDPVPWGESWDGNVKFHQNRIYWIVRSVMQVSASEQLTIVWQLGNEVNFGTSSDRNYRMRPKHIQPYLEQAFAPGVVAIRRASEAVRGDPEAALVTNGSIAMAGAADSQSWFHIFLNSEISGKHNAHQLTGRTPLELIDVLSIHYIMKGPLWRPKLRTIYDLYVRDGPVYGFWSTEEFGGTSAQVSGPFALVLAFRYMDWWSRRQWRTNKGAMFYWGDWMGRDRYPTAFIFQRIMSAFVADRDLENRTDRAKVRGSSDLEMYTFADGRPDRHHFVAGIGSESYYIQGNPSREGSTDVQSLEVPVETKKRYRVLIRKFRPDSVERILDRFVEPEEGRIQLEFTASLDHRHREALLVTASVAPEEFPDVFEKNDSDRRETNRKIPRGEVVSLYRGNWGTAPVGGRDEGMKGDGHGIIATKWFREPTFPVHLERNYSEEDAKLIVSPQGWPPGSADFLWDGKLLAEDISTTEGRRSISLPDDLDVRSGTHTFTVKMKEGRVFRLDSLTFRKPN